MWAPNIRLILVAGLLLLAGELSAQTPLPPKSEAKVRLLIPAYFYPGGEGLKHWDRLFASARAMPDVPQVAIANPNSGPGEKIDDNYTTVLKRAKQAGILLVGYVSTRYAMRSLPEVKADIDRWLEFYPVIQGFFLDEQTSDTSKVDYYRDLTAYAHSRLSRSLVITNPGTTCVPEYVTRASVDTVCLYENKTGFNDFHLPDWTKGMPAKRFAVLPYQIAEEALMRATVQKAVKDGAGYLYVTDASGVNPWDRLPTYWEAELKLIQSINGPRAKAAAGQDRR